MNEALEFAARVRLAQGAPALLKAAKRALVVLEGVAAVRRPDDALAELEAAIAACE